jgi:hypothetical protein
VLAAFRKWSSAAKTASAPVTDLSANWLVETGFSPGPVDLQAQEVLAEQTANAISNTVDSNAENILQIIALGAASGLALDVVTGQVRGRISGVQMESNDPEVRRQQRKLNKLMRTGATAAELAAVTAKIRRLTPTINSANSVRDQALKTVSDSVMNFDGAFAAGVATGNNVKKWLYAGGLMETSRPFCIQMIGSELDKDEIDSIWSGQWAGKEPGDPMTVRGGYNCQHYWVPIVEEDDEI